MTKLKLLTNQLRMATERLKEAIDQEKSDFMRDSVIQRFEFTLDLAWKTIKAVLEKEKGIACTSPKECVREAYRQNMIEYDEFWIKMIDLRNEAAHLYSEEKSEEIYSAAPRALEKFYELLKSIERK